MREIFIVVPSFRPTGPIKGAVALANALVTERTVTMAAIKSGNGVESELDPGVRRVSLAAHGGVWRRAAAYRRMLRDAGGRERVASISMLFSADVMNLSTRRVAVTCASVRGNLPEAYRGTYGPIGVPLGIGHLTLFRGFDHVVAMSDAMARQVARHAGRMPTVIGNFVDEARLEPYRNNGSRQGPLQFVFVGYLTPHKQPLAVIDAVAALRRNGTGARLDLLGEGPLRPVIMEALDRHGLRDVVTVHGHVENPFPLVARADALVLPSVAEGLSRACLEALHLGVPCVLRDRDGNGELVQPGYNGALFTTEAELSEAMTRAAEISRRSTGRGTLLPPAYRQASAAMRYLELVEQNGR
jgi:glycosyltransferase involved in cell wall biosynthesis